MVKKVIKCIILLLSVIFLLMGFIGFIKKTNNIHIINNTVNNTVISSTLIRNKHYDYEISNDIEYVEEKLFFELNDVQKKWKAVVSPIYDPDKKVYSQNDIVTEELKKYGYIIEKEEFIEIEGIKYILYYSYTEDKFLNKYYCLIGYIHPHNQLAYKVNVTNQQNIYDLEALKKVSIILSNSKRNNLTESFQYYTYDFD